MEPDFLYPLPNILKDYFPFTKVILRLSPTKRIILEWRHNGCDSVSNHQPHNCLLNRLFRRRSNKTSKLRVTGLCTGNSPWTGEFPAQRASNVENVPFDDAIMLWNVLTFGSGNGFGAEPSHGPMLTYCVNRILGHMLQCDFVYNVYII